MFVIKRTRNSNCTGPVSGTVMIDLYKVCLTCSFSPLCSLSILLAGFGVYLLGIMCLWLHTCVCTYTYAQRKLFPPVLSHPQIK